MKEERRSLSSYTESLEGMVDHASEVLGCPITVEDTSHRLLAYSKHKPETDAARIATIIGRKVPDEVIQALWREGIIQQLMVSTLPMRISNIAEVGLSERIAIAIRHDEELLGYIWIIDNELSTYESITKYLISLSAAIGKKLRMEYDAHRKQDQIIQQFLWSLLRDEYQSDSHNRDRARQIGVALPAYFQIKILEFDNSETSYDLEHLPVKAWSNQRLRIIMHTAYQHRLILLCAAPAHTGMATQDWEQFLLQLNQRFKVVPTWSGGGLCYDRYDRVSASYQEALTVIYMKQRYPHILTDRHQYEQLGYYRYLGELELIRTKHPCEPLSITRLREYDDLHQTNLLQTLYIFLAEDCNVKQAAEQLHVHTNTLVYRMKRAAEIAPIQLSSMEDKTTLYIELKLYPWVDYQHWVGVRKL